MHKTRIEVLKRNNRRSILIRDLSKYINITNESLLEVNENDKFCKKIFDKLSILPNKLKLGNDDYKKSIELSLEYLKSLSNKVSLTKNFKTRVLFFRELEIEAIELNIQEVLDKIEMILDKTGFLSGSADFILVKSDLTSGICIERNEYYYEISSWGNFLCT